MKGKIQDLGRGRGLSRSCLNFYFSALIEIDLTINIKTGLKSCFYGGPGRTRTYVGKCQQIYSLPRLTASVPTLINFLKAFLPLYDLILSSRL